MWLHCDVSNTASGLSVCAAVVSLFLSPLLLCLTRFSVALFSLFIYLSLFISSPLSLCFCPPHPCLYPPTPPARNPISNVFSFWVQSLFLSPSLSCLGSPTVNVLLSCVMRPYVLSYVCLCMDIFVASCGLYGMAVQQQRRKDGTGETISLYVQPLSFIITFFLLSLSVLLWHLSFCLPGNHITRAWISRKKKYRKNVFIIAIWVFIGPFDNILFFFLLHSKEIFQP